MSRRAPVASSRPQKRLRKGEPGDAKNETETETEKDEETAGSDKAHAIELDSDDTVVTDTTDKRKEDTKVLAQPKRQGRPRSAAKTAQMEKEKEKAVEKADGRGKDEEKQATGDFDGPTPSAPRQDTQKEHEEPKANRQLQDSGKNKRQRAKVPRKTAKLTWTATIMDESTYISCV